MERNTCSYDEFEIIRCLMKFNVNKRIDDLITNRDYRNVNKIEQMKEYDKIIDKYESIDEIINDNRSKIILNKGIKRIRVLYNFLKGNIDTYECVNTISWWNKIKTNNKHKIIAYFIYSNQIFGDRNHTTARFYLNTYANIDMTRAIEFIDYTKSNIHDIQLPCEVNEFNYIYNERDMNIWIKHTLSLYKKIHFI